jgi:hypothetical protein
MADTLRTPTKLLQAFGMAASKYPHPPKIIAFLNAARTDGLVRVPPSIFPRSDEGQPAIGALTIGGNAKLVFPNSTFYGIGGAKCGTIKNPLNIGFVLHGRTNDEAVATFRELGGEAGILVHVADLSGGVRNYDNPLVLWSLTVYAALEGSSWLSQIAEIAENPAYHFNPFTASLETLKRLFFSPSGDNSSSTAAHVLSLLDRYPATPAGHVAFLEFVRDEVHYAADAKRSQFERGYSNATIESMIRGIKWAEAMARVVTLTTLPEGVRANVSEILHRELTAGTVEQIDSLLTPAVWGVRNSIEQARLSDLAGKIVVVATAGDLLKAYAEGKRPCYQCLGIVSRPGANIPTQTCTDATAEAGRIALNHAQALVTAEGGDKAVAMEKLIARVQLQMGMDKASVINMPLADFVAAAMGRSLPKESPSQAIQAETAANPTADAGNGEPTQSTAEGSPPDSPTGFLGGAALAKALGVHATRRDAFFRQLERQRTNLGDDCWHEVRDPRPNSPRFLYRADSLKLRELATAYTKPKQA